MMDRNLRLGLQAVLEGMIGPDQFCEAIGECLKQDGLSFAAIVVARGWCSQSRLDNLERHVVEASTDDDGETAIRVEDPTATVQEGTCLGLPAPDLDRLSLLRLIRAQRYQRIKVHGVGGLGRVWRTRDTFLGREVALKELRDDRSTDPRLVARFLEEGRITSRLEHPGIVPLYDLVEGDQTNDLPFYTMRFLPGRTLAKVVEDYHRRRTEGRVEPMEFRRLLDILTAVCEAVSFAHSRDVLHRDLKGQNIIVGDYGEVFVIDWGLAKVFHADQPQEAPSLLERFASNRDETEPGSILGTLGFIAPELLDNQPATRRSDVYSLGAILYLILTGRPAYLGHDRHEVLENIRHREPIRPRTLVRSVPRPLEAICLKAMARVPSNRYATVAELADEIRRWMADEVVEAHAETLLGQLARNSRKHRSALLASLTVLTAAVIGLSIALGQIWQARQGTLAEMGQVRIERNRAEENLGLSRQLIKELTLLGDTLLSPIPGTEQARAAFYDSTLRSLRYSLRHSPTDRALRISTAQIARFSANVHVLLNEPEVAEPLFRESIQLLEALVADFSGDFQQGADLALTLADQARATASLGRLREAAELLRRALLVGEQLVTDFPDRNEARRALAFVLYSTASIEQSMGQSAEAAQSSRRAIAIYEQLMTPSTSQVAPQDRTMLGCSLHILAMTELEQGHHAGGLEVATRGIELMNSILARRPEDKNSREYMGSFLIEKARAGSALERPRQELELDLEQAIVLFDNLAKAYPRFPSHRASAAHARRVRGGLRTGWASFESAT
jgi:eukaryotic-like serine/threonine-protein kinase